MPMVRNLHTGHPFSAEAIVWTNDDSNGFTPLDQCVAVETMREFGYPDAGIYGDRHPWAFDPNGGEDGFGCFVPVELL